MTAYPFIEALHSLNVALRASGVLAPGERITINISHDAGIRFEGWLRGNPPEELVYRGLDTFRVIDQDSHAPKREVEMHGIKIQWPTGRLWTPDGPIPRPVVDAQEMLPPVAREASPMALRRVPRFA